MTTPDPIDIPTVVVTPTYPVARGLNGPISFLYGLAIAFGVIVLGGYVATAYRISYVLDFAVFGPALIITAAVLTTGALVAHSAFQDNTPRIP